VLASRITYPALGLQLDVEPSSPLREAFRRDIEADSRDWDRHHHVTARFAEQTVPFLHGVVPAIGSATEVGALRTWDDRVLVFAREAAMIDDALVDAVARQLEAIAHALAAAADAIRPPPISLDVAAWQAFAQSLHARVTPGDLALAGTLDDRAVRVRIVWHHSEPTAIDVIVASDGDPDALDAMLGRDLAVPPALAPLIATWPDDVTDLRIGDGIAAARRGFAGDRATTHASELVALLARALDALEARGGPYR
jgi:hypothetical protein